MKTILLTFTAFILAFGTMTITKSAKACSTCGCSEAKSEKSTCCGCGGDSKAHDHHHGHDHSHGHSHDHGKAHDGTHSHDHMGTKMNKKMQDSWNQPTEQGTLHMKSKGGSKYNYNE